MLRLGPPRSGPPPIGAAPQRRPGIRTTLAATGCLVAGALALTGCKGIDKSQWTASASPSVRAPTSGSGSRSGSGSGSGGSGAGTGTSPLPRVAAGVGAANDLGIAPGGTGGSRRATAATVLVRADPGVCWILTLDGNGHYGCGNASLTDTLGVPAARLTKTSGSTMVGIQLMSGGRTLSSGAVARVGRYVTVQA